MNFEWKKKINVAKRNNSIFLTANYKKENVVLTLIYCGDPRYESDLELQQGVAAKLIMSKPFVTKGRYNLINQEFIIKMPNLCTNELKEYVHNVLELEKLIDDCEEHIENLLTYIKNINIEEVKEMEINNVQN